MNIQDLPPFLQDYNVEDIRQDILNKFPSHLDRTEGQFSWNISSPFAQVMSKMALMYVQELLLRSNPLTARGEYLDALLPELPRIRATYATGNIQVSLRPNTLIPQGSLVAIEGDNTQDPIYYTTVTQASSGSTGTVIVAVRAEQAGSGSNAPVGTVGVWVSPPNLGVTAVENIDALSGGIDEEDDETYRQRYLNRARSRETTGNQAMYKNEVENIAGVGRAIVQRARYGPGTVGISVVGSNGQPAEREVLDRVQDYIAEPNRIYFTNAVHESVETLRVNIPSTENYLDLPTESYWFLKIALQAEEIKNCTISVVEKGTNLVVNKDLTSEDKAIYDGEYGIAEYHYVADREKEYELLIENEDDNDLRMELLVNQSVFDKQEHEGIASVEHRVYVESAVGQVVNIEAKLLYEGSSLESITHEARANIESYIERQIQSNQNELRYNTIGKQLLLVNGVVDFEELHINGQTNNIVLADQQVPLLGEVLLYE
ncbi:baseplate J/gp47 family protein [Geomicrobium sediminis]|uniref:Phage protein gp47/JayE n=1 Tax=Geomicrobium sediminis TaxID=1347788 RepID=A0ABS2PEY0_9BACL|nr:baseplate J/gp47 family protein [Geomicrobium sediminis]MBM7633822.1 putative phage protein gp47/JayE [Geomicrobium sediminis]